MGHERVQEIGVHRDPHRLGGGEGVREAVHGRIAVRRPRDHLGDHRVVVHADRVPGPDPGIDADAGFAPGAAVRPRFRLPAARPLPPRPRRIAPGEAQVDQAPGGRQEPAGRVLRVQARLDGVSPEGDLVLRERQGLAARHPELPFDEVGPGHQLGHRVLDLEPGVHLHEPELPAAVEQEFDGPRPLVADGAGGGDRRLAHRGPKLSFHAGRGGLLHDLLVPPLGGAVPLEEVHEVAAAVGEHLHLDVPGLRDVALEEHRIVAEGRRRLALRPREGGIEVPGPLHRPHAAPAAARGGLEQHRPTDGFRFAPQPFGRLVRSVVARYERHPGPGHEPLRLALRPHRPDRSRRGADEDDPARRARLREVRVLGEEAVAGMDGVGPAAFRRVEDRPDVQIALAGRGRPDAVGLVRHRDVQGVLVGVRADRDTPDAEAAGGPDHPAGDLAPVGDEQPLEHSSDPPPRAIPFFRLIGPRDTRSRTGARLPSRGRDLSARAKAGSTA